MNDDNNIKLRIAELRKNKHITQEELASFLGISFQSVYKWETWNAYPDITMLPKLSKYFGVSIDYLLGFDNTSDGIDTYGVIKKQMNKAPEDKIITNAFYTSSILYEGIVTNGFRQKFEDIMGVSFIGGKGSCMSIRIEKEGFMSYFNGMCVLATFEFLRKIDAEKTKFISMILQELSDPDKLSFLTRWLNCAFDNDNKLLSKTELSEITESTAEKTVQYIKDLSSVNIAERTVNENDEVCYKLKDGVSALIYPVLVLVRAMEEIR